MSSIGGAQGTTGHTSYRVADTASHASASAKEKEKETAASSASAAGDTVEISDEAKALLESAADQPAGPKKPFTYMSPEKVLVSGSKEEQEFKDLLKKVRGQKSDIMSRLEDKLEKMGVSLAGRGKLKIEVDNSGKVVVGGLDDPKLAKKIQDELNKDKALAKDLKDYQQGERDLSRLVNDYTGCSLYELTMTQQGDVNERIRETVEAQFPPDQLPRDEFYWRLGFLGETLNTTVSVDDVAALGFGGMIDFSAETSFNAEPEKNIRASMAELNEKLKTEFDAINQELADRLEAAGVEIDDAFKEQFFLNAGNTTITVDNFGHIEIQGVFAGDEAIDKKGREILARLVTEMLNDRDSNSYHVSAFVQSSNTLLRRKAEESGAEVAKNLNARVAATMTNGHVKDIRVS